MPTGRITNEGVLYSVREFITDCCQAIPGMFVSNAELHTTFKTWMHTRGKTPAQGLCLGASRFGQVFRDQCKLTITPGRHREGGKIGCGWRGLMLRQTVLDLPDSPQADLAAVAEAWPNLPGSVRAKIVTIATAIGRQ
jgi:hypothetical protein